MTLRSSDFEAVPRAVVDLCRRLRDSGFEAYLVGGSVRDLLLGRPVTDWDVTTSARPEQVQRLFKKTIATGIKHGTVTVIVAPGFPVEVTTYRGEGAYSDGRHPDTVQFVGELEQDLERRDFTINAIALDPIARALTDPMQGQRDLERRLLRAVGDPQRRFSEDGLRALRAVRFASVLQFAIDPPTLAAIEPAMATFRRVSAERVRDELCKLLVGPRPSVGVELLRESGLLGEILPELQRCVGATITPGGGDGLYRHSLQVCDAMPPALVARLAGLLHGIGRAQSAADKQSESRDPADAGADSWRQIAARLRFSNDERERVAHLIAHHVVDHQIEGEPALRRFIKRIGPAVWPDLAPLRRADLAARSDAAALLPRFDAFCGRVEQQLAIDPVLEVGQLALGGRDVMEALGRAPGPHVGEVLRALLERVIDRPELNHRDALLALIPEVAPSGD